MTWSEITRVVECQREGKWGRCSALRCDNPKRIVTTTISRFEEPVMFDEPWEPTHHLCPAKENHPETHHLRGEEMKCMFCGLTRSQLIEQHEKENRG
jgi:hypothetical protein